MQGAARFVHRYDVRIATYIMENRPIAKGTKTNSSGTNAKITKQ